MSQIDKQARFFDSRFYLYITTNTLIANWDWKSDYYVAGESSQMRKYPNMILDENEWVHFFSCVSLYWWG